MPCKLKKECKWAGEFLAVNTGCCDFFLRNHRLARKENGVCLEFEPRTKRLPISREFLHPSKVYRVPIPRHRKTLEPSKYEHMRRLYDACMNDVEIAIALDTTPRTVSNWRKRNGLPSMYDIMRKKYKE